MTIDTNIDFAACVKRNKKRNIKRNFCVIRCAHVCDTERTHDPRVPGKHHTPLCMYMYTYTHHYVSNAWVITYAGGVTHQVCAGKYWELQAFPTWKQGMTN